ncbi:iron-binding protein, partial [Proteus mirabilis]
ERFFNELRNVPAVVVTEGITPMAISEGAYKNNPNPHAWMSPNNALIYIENIRKALVEHDPDNAAIYNPQLSICLNSIAITSRLL